MNLLAAAFIIFVALMPALTATPEFPIDAYGFALLSAWLGSGMIAASLLLMIRESVWASWFGGLQQMYQWHHFLGIIGSVLLLAHPVLLAVDYWPLGSAATWEYLSPFESDLLNLLGWAALIIFMLSLTVNLISRIPYRIWRYLHMALIVALALGLWHIWLAGGISNSLMAVVTPAVVAVLWRIFRADQGFAARPYEVSSVHHPAEKIIEVMLRPLAKPLRVTPGQFVFAAFFNGPQFQGCGNFHPYTVSSVSREGNLTLSIKALGDCTDHIQSLEPGVAARIQGPFGTFLKTRSAEPEIWIAAGIGLTPFLAALREQLVNRETDLIYVHRESENIAYEEEFARSAAQQPLLHFHSLTLSNDTAPLFRVLENIDNLVERQIYLCGPSPFMAKVTEWLKEQGVSTQQIHFEQFDFR